MKQVCPVCKGRKVLPDVIDAVPCLHCEETGEVYVPDLALRAAIAEEWTPGEYIPPKDGHTHPI